MWLSGGTFGWHVQGSGFNPRLHAADSMRSSSESKRKQGEGWRESQTRCDLPRSSRKSLQVSRQGVDDLEGQVRDRTVPRLSLPNLINRMGTDLELDMHDTWERRG